MWLSKFLITLYRFSPSLKQRELCCLSYFQSPACFQGIKGINQVTQPFSVSAAHATSCLQLPHGAEAEHVSVDAEGSHRAGAGPHGAEPAVPLPAGHGPADIMISLDIIRRVCLPRLHRRFLWGFSWPPRPAPPCPFPHRLRLRLSLRTCELLWRKYMKRDYLWHSTV